MLLKTAGIGVLCNKWMKFKIKIKRLFSEKRYQGHEILLQLVFPFSDCR